MSLQRYGKGGRKDPLASGWDWAPLFVVSGIVLLAKVMGGCG